MNDSKPPREWRIHGNYLRGFLEDNEEVHVIEYSAYESLIESLILSKKQRDQWEMKARESEEDYLHCVDQLNNKESELKFENNDLKVLLKSLEDQLRYERDAKQAYMQQMEAVEIELNQLKKENNELKAELAAAREVLKHSMEIIDGEFCIGSQHHPVCDECRKALEKIKDEP